MHQFYLLDYRVRIHVANALLKKLAKLRGGKQDNPILQNLFLQCALCYEIGFGVVRDPYKAQELIRSCDVYDRHNFVRELGLVKVNRYGWGTISTASGSSTTFRRMFLARTGNEAPIHNLSLSYIRHANVEDIELQYRKEITDVENSLGANHHFVILLKGDLRGILGQRGQQLEAEDIKAQRVKRSSQLNLSGPEPLWSENNLAAILELSKEVGRSEDAEELCRQALSSASKRLDVNQLATVGASSVLSEILAEQGRWKEAEELLVPALETSAKELGQTHPDVLDLVRILAGLYAKQGMWEEAETLVARSIDTSIEIMGEEHPNSITHMGQRVVLWTLQQQWRSQGRRQWKTIESLQVEVMKKYIKVCGRDDPYTINSMNNLASIWASQGLWRIAKILFGHVIKASTESFGEENRLTLFYMTQMAVVYQREIIHKDLLNLIRRRRRKCDGKWHRKLFQLSAKTHGWDHLMTLDRADRLGWILTDLRQFKEAEALQVRIVETRVRLQGEKHRDVLKSMRLLALTIREQGRLKEAIKLMDKGLQGESLFRRHYHRFLLSLNIYREIFTT